MAVVRRKKLLENKENFNVIKYVDDTNGAVTIQVVNKNGVVYSNDKTEVDYRNIKYSKKNNYYGVEFIGTFNTTIEKVKDYADVLASYVDLENFIIDELHNITHKYKEIMCSIRDIYTADNNIKITVKLDEKKRSWITNDVNRMKSIIINEILDNERKVM